MEGVAAKFYATLIPNKFQRTKSDLSPSSQHPDFCHMCFHCFNFVSVACPSRLHFA